MNQKPKKKVKFKDVLNTVSSLYKIRVKDILSKKRKEEIVKARQVIAYIVRENLKMSFPAIGRKLGRRDHTTAIHSYNKVKDLRGKNRKLDKEVALITDYLFPSVLKENPIVFEKTKEHYFEEKKYTEKKSRKKYSVVRSLNDFPNQNISPEYLKRQQIILEKYNTGITLEEIGREFDLTRERIRQIVERGFINEARNLVKDGIALNLEEFLKQKRREHLISLSKKQGKNSSLVNDGDKINKEKRWSKYYDSCRGCGTVVIAHHSHGYCKKCYAKTDLFREIQEASRLRNIEARRKYVSEYSKEYSKRPEIIAKRKKRENMKLFGGNREKAILRDGEKCRKCGLSREENLKRSGKDLYVLHIGDKKDHRLENLITICSHCFSSIVFNKKK